MPSYLDIGVIGVVLVSALLAMVRGFTREVLAIASWIAAAIAAVYLYPYVVPYIKPHVAKEPWAQIASGTIVFFVVLFVVWIVTINLSDAILESKAGPLDRSLGFLFGAARGFLLCVIAYVLFSMFDPPGKQPAWMEQAKTRPLLDRLGADMKTMLPHDLLDTMNKYIKPKAVPAEEQQPPSESDQQNGTGPNAPDSDTTEQPGKADIERDSAPPRPSPATK